MKKNLILLGLVIVMAASSVFAGDLDFSGSWILDESKLEEREGGRGRGMSAKEMAVKQEKNKLTIERFISNEWMGDVTQVETMSLDGKETENDMGMGTKTSSAEWAKDKKSLILHGYMEMERGGNIFEITMTDTWALEEGGKVLKIHSMRETSRGERENTIFYNKK